jgi:hypothetical protein
MPRRAKPAEGNPGEGASLKDYLERAIALQFEIDRITKAAAKATKAKCGPHREDLKELVREAAEAGFPRQEFNGLRKKARLEDQIEHIADDFGDDGKARYQEMLESLGEFGETPLGRAAIDEAEARL